MSAAFTSEEAERRMPPATRSTVTLLRDYGHSVVVRVNRNGALRYRLDNSKEFDALSLSRRYFALYER